MGQTVLRNAQLYNLEYFVDQRPMARGAIESDVRVVHFEFLSTSQLRIGTLSRMLGKSRGPF
jgi:hypothetical protein